jgi:hypothetical protein
VPVPARALLSRAGARECAFVGKATAGFASKAPAVWPAAGCEARGRVLETRAPLPPCVTSAGNPRSDVQRRAASEETALGGKRADRLVGLRGVLSCKESIRTAVDQPMVSSDRAASYASLAASTVLATHFGGRFARYHSSRSLNWPPFYASSLAARSRRPGQDPPGAPAPGQPPPARCRLEQCPFRQCLFRRCRSLQQWRAPLPRLDAQ